MKKKPEEADEGGFLSNLIEQVQDKTGVHVFEMDDTGEKGPSPTGSYKPEVSPSPAPAFASEPSTIDIPIPTPLTTSGAQVSQPDPKIRKQIEGLLRQLNTPEVQAVIKFEAEYKKLSMISNDSERRSAALAICSATAADLITGYQTMIKQLAAEKSNDENFISSKIAELDQSNDSERQRISSEIQRNQAEIQRLTDSNNSLSQSLDNLDYRISNERRKLERGGAVFQVTANAVEQDLQKILADLKK